MSLCLSIAIVISTTISAQKYFLNKHNIVRNNIGRADIETFPYGFNTRWTTKFSHFGFEELQNTLHVGVGRTMPLQAIRRTPHIMRYHKPPDDRSNKSKHFSNYPPKNKPPEKLYRDHFSKKQHLRNPEKGLMTPKYSVNDIIQDYPLKDANLIRHKDSRTKGFFSRGSANTNAVRYKLSKEVSETLHSAMKFNRPRDILPLVKPSYAKHLNPQAKTEYSRRYDTQAELGYARDKSLLLEQAASGRNLYPPPVLGNFDKYSPQIASNNYARERKPAAETPSSDKDLYPQAEDNSYKEIKLPKKSPKSLRNIHAANKIFNTNLYNPQAEMVYFARNDSSTVFENYGYAETDNFARDLNTPSELDNAIRYGPQVKKGKNMHPLASPNLNSDKELFLTPEGKPNKNEAPETKKYDFDYNRKRKEKKKPPKKRMSKKRQNIQLLDHRSFESDKELFLTPEERPEGHEEPHRNKDEREVSKNQHPLNHPSFESDKELFLTPEERPDEHEEPGNKKDDFDDDRRPEKGVSSEREPLVTPEEKPVSSDTSQEEDIKPGADGSVDLVKTTPDNLDIAEIGPADPLQQEEPTIYNEATTLAPTTIFVSEKLQEIATGVTGIHPTEESRYKHKKNTQSTSRTRGFTLPDVDKTNVVEYETHPYIVAMMLEQKRRQFITVCSGSLITELWVLVAAHCLHEDPKVLENGRIYFGNFSVSSKNYRKIKKAVPFPNYYYGIEYAGPIKNDIGLVMVSEPIRRNICRSIAKLSSIDYQVLIGAELRYALIKSLRNWSPPLLPLGVITITGQLPEYAQTNVSNMRQTDNVVSVKCPGDFLGPSICLHRQCRNEPIKVKPQDVGSPLLFHNRIVGICSGYSTYQTENRDEYVLRYTPVSPYLSWIYDVVTKRHKNWRRKMPDLRRFAYKGIPKPRPFKIDSHW